MAMKMARDKLETKINIIEIVKSWRYFENALKELLPERKRIDLKERSRYIQIDPDESKVSYFKKSFLMHLKRKSSSRRVNMSDGFFSSEDINDEI